VIETTIMLLHRCRCRRCARIRSRWTPDGQVGALCGGPSFRRAARRFQNRLWGLEPQAIFGQPAHRPSVAVIAWLGPNPMADRPAMPAPAKKCRRKKRCANVDGTSGRLSRAC